jgi:uncharacterized membrane protein YkvA (DUF1232 family)
MRDVLRRGLESILNEGKNNFRTYLEQNGFPAEWEEKAYSSIMSIPDVLLVLNQLTYDRNAPLAARALFPALVSYMLNEADLIPSHKGQLVIGLLDDAFLVHCVARKLAAKLSDHIKVASDEHLAFLEKIVPEEVREELEAIVEETITEAVRQAEQLGL